MYVNDALPDWSAGEAVTILRNYRLSEAMHCGVMLLALSVIDTCAAETETS